MTGTSLPDGRRAFVSTLPAGSGERRLALAVVLASVAIFAAAVPFATMPPGQLWHQLHQVIVNLIANAHYAMRQSAGPRRITLASEFDAAAARVRLTITDTGPGIPPDVQARMFEPFFTTKPPGEGTGLGLSLCRGILQEHGGTLAVESEPGHGATFIVTLPVASVDAVSAIEPAAPVTPMIPKRILVVDDEPDIAATLVETLEHDGHKVDVAADGAEALARVQGHDDDVIVTDTKMPRIDGPAFYRELARRMPALARRVVFVTGDLMDREKREWLGIDRQLDAVEAVRRERRPPRRPSRSRSGTDIQGRVDAWHDQSSC